MKQIKFGIIGCGNIAARFAKALAEFPDAMLYACGARESGRAQTFAGKYGAEKAYGNYQDVWEDCEVDAVYIATVHNTHAEIAKSCILAGKAVICEKPFFVNAHEAKEVISLAREKSVLVMEAFWTRTMPAYQKVKEWIADGRLGKLRLIRAAFCFSMPYNEDTRDHRLWNPATAGGALLDAGVYPYQYVTGIMGGPPERVTASVCSGPTGVDATVAMTLEYPELIGDCLTSIVANMDDTAVISGEKGYILQYYFLGSRRAERYDSQGKLVESFIDSVEEGFVHEIAHFIQLYREGKVESPWIPLEDNLDFAKHAEEILRQIQS